MQITLKRLSSPRKDGHLVLLFNGDAFPEKLFSKSELAFIRAERKADKKFIAVNQYSRMIYLQQMDKEEKALHVRLENARKSGATMFTRLHAAKHEELTVHSVLDAAIVLAYAEGLVLGGYQFLKYRSGKKKEEHTVKALYLDVKGLSDKDVQRQNILNEAVFKARDLVNEPQSFLNATEFGRQFTHMGKAAGFKVQVLNKAKIKQLRMGGLLAVNLGSPQPPTFTIMEWKPKNAVNKKPYVLVGKGVVYDTGGMSLKPTPNSMDYMKCDMGGGATVGGTLFALAKAKIPVHVIGLVPATDNRPDGDAYVPGDVITMMSGKTVEVLNTDAEGRLILADALHYAKRYQPELVMEFSTLTGAAAAAIGPQGIVCMGDVDEKTRRALHEAGNMVYERLAEFPFWEEYDELIKSDLADIKNVGGPSAGAITAGRFLNHFVDYPYMHFDIAAPAFSKSNDSYRGKNGTGVGVRLMFEYFRTIAG
ncbi:MAG: leucyl aminopeptidase [Bacteroidia bacterium]|nr:leucyl aminopeptidase [Bacteroidia bacterium]